MVTISQHQFKITVATAVLVCIFIVTASIQFATWKAEMGAEHKEFDDRITHVGEKHVGMRSDINNLKEKANDRDVELAKINTKLSNIETLLIEIKADLREHER